MSAIAKIAAGGSAYDTEVLACVPHELRRELERHQSALSSKDAEILKGEELGKGARRDFEQARQAREALAKQLADETAALTASRRAWRDAGGQGNGPQPLTSISAGALARASSLADACARECEERETELLTLRSERAELYAAGAAAAATIEKAWTALLRKEFDRLIAAAADLAPHLDLTHPLDVPVNMLHDNRTRAPPFAERALRMFVEESVDVMNTPIHQLHALRPRAVELAERRAALQQKIWPRNNAA